MVEHHRQVGRRLGRGAHVDQQLPQHVAEALDRADRQAVRLSRQRRQGMEGPEDESGSVHQIEADRGAVLRQLADSGVEGVGHGAEE